jgi:hypothetical protein
MKYQHVWDDEWGVFSGYKSLHLHQSYIEFFLGFWYISWFTQNFHTLKIRHVQPNPSFLHKKLIWLLECKIGDVTYVIWALLMYLYSILLNWTSSRGVCVKIDCFKSWPWRKIHLNFYFSFLRCVPYLWLMFGTSLAIFYLFIYLQNKVR